MRQSSEAINTIVSVEKTLVASTERIIEINENKVINQISVCYGLYDDQESLIDQRHCIIQGEFYELIMSESPDFAPGKPANEYREADLWHVIDLVKQSES